jgi:hypothetical protein
VPDEDKRETADAFLRSIELELAGKRARRERDRERHRTIRLLSFSFLSLVILAALLVLWFTFSRANEMPGEHHPSPGATASPRSSP